MTASTFTAASCSPTGAAASNTYFFGSGGGKDTISFANVSTSSGQRHRGPFAVDSSYGATCQHDVHLRNIVDHLRQWWYHQQIFVSGITGGTSAVTNGQAVTLTTVSSSVITDLG